MTTSEPTTESSWIEVPPLAICEGCGAWTWSPEQVGQKDQSIQDDDLPCGGVFRAVGTQKGEGDGQA